MQSFLNFSMNFKYPLQSHCVRTPRGPCTPGWETLPYETKKYDNCCITSGALQCGFAIELALSDLVHLLLHSFPLALLKCSHQCNSIDKVQVSIACSLMTAGFFLFCSSSLC